ncbi:LCP family protein [Nocardia stercoris]|uniref:LytR family transcriptional regulator n=1 Tax=Nocardia stercoris TaxID=2483361 RepID=A0A3M2LDX4_9NOCA|nr:LCP family protein [Nocardia stercoris]RMI34175.1 LytR family transcriptional regulator [Nocardia stercoris]
MYGENREQHGRRRWVPAPDRRPAPGRPLPEPAPRPPQPRPAPHQPRPIPPLGHRPAAPARPVPPPNRRGRTPPPSSPAPHRKHRIGRWLLVALLILALIPIGSGIYFDTTLQRVAALGDYSGRPAQGGGTNWLLAGSDSRAGLSAAEESQLSTGDIADAGGERSDTIILVHIPGSGPATVVSLPRDSYVPIPGIGRDKLNAAFAAGGPKLLAQTVETITGLRIDHFAKIGFGGFAGLVDDLGGIDMCLPYAVDDPLAGIDLPAGCQRLSGPQALGFVRSRATPRADLDRMNNQRLFLSALLHKASSPATLLDPFTLFPMVAGIADNVTVDNGDHIWDLASLGWALHSDIVATTVPIGGFENTADSGNVLLWDRARAGAFFDALAKDRPVPDDLITR